MAGWSSSASECSPSSGGGEAGSSYTATSERGANGGPCAELRSARDQPIGDTGAEDAETEQREGSQDNRHGIINAGGG